MKTENGKWKDERGKLKDENGKWKVKTVAERTLCSRSGAKE